jgi:hypothetical protein
MRSFQPRLEFGEVNSCSQFLVGSVFACVLRTASISGSIRPLFLTRNHDIRSRYHDLEEGIFPEQPMFS